MSEKKNIYIGFLSELKEYILIFAMLIAAILYLSNYVAEIPDDLFYLKWIVSVIVILTIFSAYFFTLRPALIKKKELNLRPKGEPDEQYFTTSPRIDDKYNFFASGYEQYLEWLKQTKEPILYLTGSSGSGKSSLINAYISPQLQKSKHPLTNVYPIRSYHDPLKTLYEELQIGDDTNPLITEEIVYNVFLQASKMLSAGERILVILDQFEEFFLLHNHPEDLENRLELKEIKEIESFFQRFLNNPPEGIQILLSYRSDFQQLIDQLQLPARTEDINFKQLNPLTFVWAEKFIKECPGLEIPQLQLSRILKEAASIDTPVTIRPIVLNFLGIILQRMLGYQSLPNRGEKLIKRYIVECLGKELRLERASIIKAMLTDFSTARPSSISELCKNSSLTISQLDNQMIIMQRHGLVRCLNPNETSQSNRKWQIAHDFIALQLEKVVHGIRKTFWQKLTPWIAPALICVLLFFSATYYANIQNWEEKKAIENINKAGLLWNTQTKTISISNVQLLTDSLFQGLISDLFILQPDSLKLNFLHEDTVHQISHLNGLNKVKSLKCIYVSNNDKISNLDGLKGLTTLTRLNLDEVNNLQNIEALKTLTTLTNLKINNCKNLKSFDPLKGLKALRYLFLAGCYNLININALEQCNTLTYLELRNCNKLENIDGIKELTTLSYLEISSCWVLKDFGPLKALTNLTSLDLGADQLQNVDALKELINLTDLQLSECDELQNVDGLKAMKSLTHLDLNDCGQLKNIDGLKGLTALTDLELGMCKNLENIDALMRLPNLKEVFVIGTAVPEIQIKKLKKGLIY
ncbi:MAG: leucine-rich repeat protein [Bacteroidia bacterium]